MCIRDRSRPRLPSRTANGAWPVLGGRRLWPGPIDLDTEPAWNSSWSLCTNKLMISAYYSSIDPERMKGWVDLVGWPAADGLPTWVVTRQLQIERRTGKVRRPKTDVLPLSQRHQPTLTKQWRECSGVRACYVTTQAYQYKREHTSYFQLVEKHVTIIAFIHHEDRQYNRKVKHKEHKNICREVCKQKKNVKLLWMQKLSYTSGECIT